jgi:hypothetical protein
MPSGAVLLHQPAKKNLAGMTYLYFAEAYCSGCEQRVQRACDNVADGPKIVGG